MSEKITMACTLDVYVLSLELVRRVEALLPLIRRHDKSLADQASRAVGGVPLHIVEGVYRRGKDRGHLLTVGLSSTKEAHACMDVAWAKGYITAAQHNTVAPMAVRVAKMIIGTRK